MPASRISKWLAGQGEPTARQALRLARMFEVPIEWFLDDERDFPVPDSATEVDMLSKDEQHLIWVMRSLGVDEAKTRLLGPPRVEQRPDLNSPGSQTHWIAGPPTR